MARLIYALLAFALGTLVAGFLTRSSSLPLLVSIGLSGVVLLMILIGTSRRLRRDEAADDDEPLTTRVEMVEIDEDDEDHDLFAPDPADEATVVTERKPRPRRRDRAAATATMQAAKPAAAAVPQSTIDMPVTLPDESRAKRKPVRRKAAARTSRTAAVATPAGPPAPSVKVWVIPGRTRYHEKSCRFVKGDQVREVTEATARRRGYVACTVCQPGSQPA